MEKLSLDIRGKIRARKSKDNQKENSKWEIERESWSSYEKDERDGGWDAKGDEIVKNIIQKKGRG